jgi:hypothetical protein
MIPRILSLVFAAGVLLGAQTRPVLLNWTVSTSSGVTGYIISTGSSPTGTFNQIGCTGTVPGSTCVSGSTATTTTFLDPAETIGVTIYYEIQSYGTTTGIVATQATQATVGSTTITIAAANPAIIVGATVTGVGIASGTAVSAVSGTTVTLTIGITAALSNTSITFSTFSNAASAPLQAVYLIPAKTNNVISTTIIGQ